MALGQGVSVLSVAGVQKARASRAVEGALVGAGADSLEAETAEDELAQVLGCAAERIDVALGGGRGAAIGSGAEAERNLLVKGRVDLV